MTSNHWLVLVHSYNVGERMMPVLPKLLAGTGLEPMLGGDLFIGGQWRGGEGGERIDVIDPATGERFADVADARVADARAAVDAASAAAKDWAATPPRQRGEVLRKAFELMSARAEQFAQLIALENGKAMPDARGEVTYAAEFFRWFSEEAVRIGGEITTAPNGDKKIMVQYQPIGVSVLITPWNFPAAMATRKIGPALAAGCTVVLKPATETPFTAYALAALLAEAGVPNGVVNVLTSSQSGEVVGAMLEDPRVRKLSFTGSTQVGRILMKAAADQVIHCSMELGGNAPFIVFDDADIDKALDGAMLAKMRNGGEACTAANRIYVQRGIAERFSSALAERMGAMKVGAGYDPDTTCGPLINPKALERIDGWVREAVSDGAKVLTGGSVLQRPGYFYPPTVVTEVPSAAKLMTDEIFGPVAPISVFDTEDEVIEKANDTEYGLVAYLFTEDLKKGLRVSEALEAGMVGLNRGLVSDPASPFGGVKQSGIGREGGHHGVLEFSEAKYIAVEW